MVKYYCHTPSRSIQTILADFTMLMTVAKTIFQVVNFLLWLVGLVVFGLTCWIISDYDLTLVRGDHLAFMDHILHDQAGESGARCREVTREVLEDVTNHVMEKVCSLL